MALLLVQDINRDGIHLDPTETQAPPEGGEFANTGCEVLVFTNQGERPVHLELPIQARIDGQPVQPKEVIALCGQVTLAGPFPPGVYGDRMQVRYGSESVTGLGISVVRIGGS